MSRITGSLCAGELLHFGLYCADLPMGSGLIKQV